MRNNLKWKLFKYRSLVSLVQTSVFSSEMWIIMSLRLWQEFWSEKPLKLPNVLVNQTRTEFFENSNTVQSRAWAAFKRRLHIYSPGKASSVSPISTLTPLINGYVRLLFSIKNLPTRSIAIFLSMYLFLSVSGMFDVCT